MFLKETERLLHAAQRRACTQKLEESATKEKNGECFTLNVFLGRLGQTVVVLS